MVFFYYYLKYLYWYYILVKVLICQFFYLDLLYNVGNYKIKGYRFIYLVFNNLNIFFGDIVSMIQIKCMFKKFEKDCRYIQM